MQTTGITKIPRIGGYFYFWAQGGYQREVFWTGSGPVLTRSSILSLLSLD